MFCSRIAKNFLGPNCSTLPRLFSGYLVEKLIKQPPLLLTGSYHVLTVTGPSKFRLSRLYNVIKRSCTNQGERNDLNMETTMQLKRVLVLSKITRYEYERQRHEGISEKKLEKLLAERGSDYKKLLQRNDIHQGNIKQLCAMLEENGINYKVVQRKEYNETCIDWADLVISAGGDGTYLSAASKIHDAKPLIGINTDPNNSEGHLCLPNKYSTDFNEVLQKLKQGKFRWKWRQRIRVTVDGAVPLEPVDLQDQNHRDQHWKMREKAKLETTVPGPRILPIKALNEVFIGETLSSVVSYYVVNIDDGPAEKQKSSGITICTGSGSTSWSFNTNKLSSQSLQEILRIVKEETGCNIPESQDSVKRIVDRFNDSLVFDPSDVRMAYTVRDPVVNRIFAADFPRGFAKRISIRSRCFDACLVLDSGYSFIFNDGAMATLETREEDALRTLELIEEEPDDE
ncbi:NAD kinase 2, mitochondrial-like [Anneissia japonica]|uniref:NAD kinase 2, mitochondrial-like n=1 Tax=Anneissia japonica TaxID=1529436 RepID=UPI0014257FA7|nr:NAD kinase 2, mitochondrial-like [Anneissia japonica]